MNRREFARYLGVTVIAIPAARLLSACGDDTTTTTIIQDFSVAPGPPAPVQDLSTPATPQDLAVSSITYTSSLVSGHQHQLTLEVSLFSNPPAADTVRQTTVAQSHSHTVTLTQAQLQSIGAGGTVTVTTSVVLEHVHTFMFTNQG
jgi:hypothetical protein